MKLDVNSQAVWESKYAAHKDETYEQGCERVVKQIAPYLSPAEQDDMYHALARQCISPGGRVWYSSGKPKFKGANCALLSVQDSAQGWAQTLHDATLSLTAGMGVGVWVNNVRYAGAPIKGSGGTASGTLSYVSMLDEVASHIRQGNTRRAAMHAAIRYDHRDANQWLTAKQHDSRLKALKAEDYNLIKLPFEIHNLSIQYTPEFLEEYNRGDNYATTFWNEHTRTMFQYGDPSIQFDADNQVYRNACTEIISDTEHDTCILGSLNLANIDTLEQLVHYTKLLLKMLMVIRMTTTYAYDRQQEVALNNMRVGLGVMGIHNWLLQRGYSYEVVPELDNWLQVWAETCEKYKVVFADELDCNVPVATRCYAPTGSISRLYGSVSSGIEPIFASAYQWRYQSGNERMTNIVIDPNVLSMLQAGTITPDTPIEDAYSLANPEGFKRRVEFQAKMQSYIDNATSSTINLPSWNSEGNNESTLPHYRQVLLDNLQFLRGITVYADGTHSGQPLEKISLSEALDGYTDSYSQYSNCNSGLCSL